MDTTSPWTRRAHGHDELMDTTIFLPRRVPCPQTEGLVRLRGAARSPASTWEPSSCSNQELKSHGPRWADPSQAVPVLYPEWLQARGRSGCQDHRIHTAHHARYAGLSPASTLLGRHGRELGRMSALRMPRGQFGRQASRVRIGSSNPRQGLAGTRHPVTVGRLPVPDRRVGAAPGPSFFLSALAAAEAPDWYRRRGSQGVSPAILVRKRTGVEGPERCWVDVASRPMLPSALPECRDEYPLARNRRQFGPVPPPAPRSAQ